MDFHPGQTDSRSTSGSNVDGEVRGEVVSGFERLPADRAFPILPQRAVRISGSEPIIRFASDADDGSRTRDLRLGKPTLYRLSYVRAVVIVEPKDGSWPSFTNA
jgi:hypothetical protein